MANGKQLIYVIRVELCHNTKLQVGTGDNMFDKEIIIDILKNKIVTNEENDWNAVVDDYEVKDGFYIFKFNKDAYFFINNTLMDCCPGYYAEAGEGHGKHF